MSFHAEACREILNRPEPTPPTRPSPTPATDGPVERLRLFHVGTRAFAGRRPSPRPFNERPGSVRPRSREAGNPLPHPRKNAVFARLIFTVPGTVKRRGTRDRWRKAASRATDSLTVPGTVKAGAMAKAVVGRHACRQAPVTPAFLKTGRALPGHVPAKRVTRSHTRAKTQFSRGRKRSFRPA